MRELHPVTKEGALGHQIGLRTLTRWCIWCSSRWIASANSGSGRSQFDRESPPPEYNVLSSIRRYCGERWMDQLEIAGARLLARGSSHGLSKIPLLTDEDAWPIGLAVPRWSPWHPPDRCVSRRTIPGQRSGWSHYTILPNTARLLYGR